MASKHALVRYRKLYARLLRFYPKPYRDRFGEGMEQTFHDLCRERREYGLFAFVLWMCLETSAGILRENILMHHKSLLRIVLAPALILLVPLVAMQFTDEVAWSPGDFAAAWVLMAGVGFAYKLMTRQAADLAYRAAAGLALAAAFILIWANLAVGIIGSENNPANLLYGGVILVGAVGTIIAHFQPRGMARALSATAIAQVLVPIIALLAWQSRVTWTEFGLNGIFALLFTASVLLFRYAAHKQKRPAGEAAT